MNLTSVKIIKSLLAEFDTRPSKRMGQNFLVDKKVLSNILEAATLTKNDTIIEVGPGLGVLTRALAERAGKIIAIEKDSKMIGILKETLKDFANVEVVAANALTYNIEEENYNVVANIPYYLTSPLIRKFLEAKNQPKQMVLMIQKEVAQRICAKPPNMSLLAASVQFYAEAKITSYVKKESFWPSPKVDSAIVKITPQPQKTDVNTKLFFKIVKAGFAQPRKQLINNLTKYLIMEKAHIKRWLEHNAIAPERRPETLSIKDWKILTSTLDGV